MKKNTKALVIAALLAALVCVSTMVVKIPSPLKGYINLGDCMVLLSGWLLSPSRAAQIAASSLLPSSGAHHRTHVSWLRRSPED